MARSSAQRRPDHSRVVPSRPRIAPSRLRMVPGRLRMVPGTLRGRITLVYAVGMAVVVSAGLVLGYLGLTTQLRNATAQDLGTRLDDLAAAVEVGATAPLQRDPYAQLIVVEPAGGRVSARSPSTPTVPVLTGSELATAARQQITIHRSAPGLGPSALLIAQPVRGGRVVLAGASLAPVELASGRILFGLTLLGPLLVVALTVTVRRLVDTALAPVAALTAAADSLVPDNARPGDDTADPLAAGPVQQDRRLPEPPGDDEIAKLARTLNGMLSRLAATRERERAFIDDAAHELRTPVAVLRAELELGLSDHARPAPDGPDQDPARDAPGPAAVSPDTANRAGTSDADQDGMRGVHRDPIRETDRNGTHDMEQDATRGVDGNRMRGADQDGIRDTLRRALVEADRIGRLADGLLVLARARSGQLELDRQPTDVTALLRSWTARLGTVTGAQVLVAGPELVATVDALRIEQLVTNLVGNATEAGAARVEVRLAADGPAGLVLEVSDDGPGFAAGVLPVAFDRFSRGDPATDGADRHAGLGLAIVAAVVRAHGGSVEAGNGSQLGGAWIRVTLPAPAQGC